MSSFRHLFRDAEKVVVARIIGEMTGAVMLRHLRGLAESHTHIVTYASIVDVRRWFGVLADQDLIEQYEWIKDFQKRVGVTPKPLPHLAYLCNEFTGGAAFLAQFAAFRRGAVSAVKTVEEAWRDVCPNLPIPAEVSRFLNKR